MCRSGIVGVGTMVAQEIDAENTGVQSVLTTPGVNCGGGAGEAKDVSVFHLTYALSSSVCIKPFIYDMGVDESMSE